MEPNDVEKIAALARLDLDTEEAREFGSQLASILEYFESLLSVESETTTGSTSALEAKERNALRGDRSHPATSTEGRERLLPLSRDSDGLLAVPRILD